MYSRRVPSAHEDPDAIARLLRTRIADRAIELEVTGSSMARTIETGATVLVEHAPVARPGQIWLFIDDQSRLVVHRVRSVSDGMVTGRGSGNPIDDEPVSTGRLVGRVRVAVDAENRSRRFGWWDQYRAAVSFRLRQAARQLLRRIRR